MNASQNGNGRQPRRTTSNVPRPDASRGKPPISKQSPKAQPQTEQLKRRPSANRQMQSAPRPPQRSAPVRPRSDLSDNLRSQTPLNRQLRKQSAPSEPGTVRRTSTPQQFKVQQGKKKPSGRKNRRRSSSFLKSVVILGVAAYLILIPIIVLVSSVLLNSGTSRETNDFRYQIGDGDNIVSRKTYPYTRVRRGNIYYIEMDSLADYCNLTITGDSKVMRYVVRESSETVEFLIGQSVAYINGVPERTGGNAFVRSGKVYVPLEFAKRCFLNLDITLDLERNSITIVRHTDEKGTYLPLDFPYKLISTTDRINFAELDVQIQEEIIKQNQPTPPESGEGAENNN